MSGTRKYFTELGWVLTTEGAAAFRPSVMPFADKMNPEARAVLDNASIYFICARPRIRINERSIRRVGNDLQYELVLSAEEGQITENATFPEFFDRVPVSAVRLHESLSFYLELVLKDQDGSTFKPVELFIPQGLFKDVKLFDYEVLYIGQSQIGKATGNILSRLRNHSTLQRILADMQANTPHLEPFIMCFSLGAPSLVMMMDPKVAPLTSDEQDTEHVLRALTSPPADSQVTTIAEAALIRYFRPHYNLRLKDSFPSTNLGLLGSCYDLDLIALTTELDTEVLDGPVYSPSQRPRYHHIATFDLHSPEQRMSFFHHTIERDGLMVDLQGSVDRAFTSRLRNGTADTGE
jgi:hypothetical protein